VCLFLFVSLCDCEYFLELEDAPTIELAAVIPGAAPPSRPSNTQFSLLLGHSCSLASRFSIYAFCSRLCSRLHWTSGLGARTPCESWSSFAGPWLAYATQQQTSCKTDPLSFSLSLSLLHIKVCISNREKGMKCFTL
jgi:hypothetical protein